MADTAEALRALADRMAKAGGKRLVITEDSARLAAYGLRAYADLLSRPVEDYPTYTVDVWNEGASGVIETMARCSNALVARAAFEQAVRQRGRYEVTLRNGARVIAIHRPEPRASRSKAQP